MILRNIIIYITPFLVGFFLFASCSEKKLKNREDFQEKKIGVVDVLRLVEAVEFKKEIYELKKPTFDQLNLEKDSLLMLRKMHIKNENYEAVRRVETRFNQTQDNIKSLEAEFNEQIMNKLNILIQEYAEENEYNAILGGTGNGGILYSDDTMDITNELLNYINSKH